ncbi:hypothetical protein D3C73_1664310 [compost metagenome]
MLPDIFKKAAPDLVTGIGPLAQLQPLTDGQFDAVPRTLEPKNAGVAHWFKRHAVDTGFDAHETPVQG